jgi:hypothetical protein
MAMFNATQDEAIALPAGGDWTVAMRAIAYDGTLTAERLAAWRART